MNYDLSAAPTLLKFHNSTAKIRAVGGCPGSGKSVAMCMEVAHFLAQRQEPDNENIRKTRTCIIRSTYPKLRRTTKKTMLDWLLPGSGTITDSPMQGTTRYMHPSGDGTTVQVEFIFLSMEGEKSLDDLDSLEVSSIFLNEANELSEAVFVKCNERIGRYPSPKDGAKCTEPSLLMDFNLPGEEHWIHKFLVRKDFKETEKFKHSDMELFLQPPAVFCDNYLEVLQDNAVEPDYRMNPSADNLKNLPDGYYDIQLSLNNWNQTQSRLMMKWVTPNTGKVIHEDYKEGIHKAREPVPVESRQMVYVGFDTSGLNKGFAFCQYIKGQLRVLREGYLNGGTETAIEQVLMTTLASEFPQCPVIVVCDPANPKDERTAVTATALLKNEYGLNAVVANGNNRMSLRINAVAKFMKRVEGFTVDPSCKMITEGLGGGYVFQKDHTASRELGKDVYKNKKNDNQYAHYVDALQNVCLHLLSNSNQQQQIPTNVKVRKRRMV